MGFDLLPWQQQVCDVALEHDGHGNLHHREVVLTVPRQSGKTQLLLVAMVHRLTAMAARLHQPLVDAGKPDLTQRAYFSAQSGNAARVKMMDDWLTMLGGKPGCSPVPLSKVYRSTGTEYLEFSEDPWRGVVRIVGNTADSGHGNVVDLAMLDEVWADEDDRREQTFRPGMNTRMSPQMWMTSTAGTDRSLYLRRKVDVGRLACERGDDSPVAYFEWSAPEDANLDDEDVWWSCMPALGITTPIEAIRTARATMSDSGFARAYLNVWTATDEAVIPMDRWLRCESAEAAPAEPWTFAIDANPMRTAVSIAVSDGVNVEHVGSYGQDHFDDAVADVVRMAGSSRRVAVDASSPIASRVAEMRAAGVDVDELDAGDVKDACADLFDAVTAGRLGVIPAEPLRLAAEGARKKRIGDRFVWSRQSSKVDLTPLTAATFARFSANRPGPVEWSWLLGE